MLFNGPTPAMQRVYLVIGVHCKILFIWGNCCSLVLVLGCAAPSGGGTAFGFGAQGRVPCLQEIGQQCAVEDNMRYCVCAICACSRTRWREQMGDLQCAVPCDVLRGPRRKGSDGRRELGQAA